VLGREGLLACLRFFGESPIAAAVTAYLWYPAVRTGSHWSVMAFQAAVWAWF